MNTVKLDQHSTTAGSARTSWLPPHCAATLARRYRLSVGQLHAIVLAYELAPRSADLVDRLAAATVAEDGQPLAYASAWELVSTLDLLWPSVSALQKVLARLDEPLVPSA